jgi:DNA-binding protein H-NS
MWALILQDGDKTTMALKTMPIAKLQDLKSKIEAAISAKVSERRRELETELSKLARFGGGGKVIKFGRGGQKGPVAPKYRNPENPDETWAGRGLKPRWLSAAIKGGRKLDDFLIPGPSKASAARPSKKTRKMRKAKN